MPCGYDANVEKIENPAGFQLSHIRLDNARGVAHIPTRADDERLLGLKDEEKIKGGDANPATTLKIREPGVATLRGWQE